MTDVKKGLTANEVEQLTNDGMVNVSVGKQSKTIGQIVAGNVFTYFNLIFAVFAVLLAFVRSYNNMTFLPVIISTLFYKPVFIIVAGMISTVLLVFIYHQNIDGSSN